MKPIVTPIPKKPKPKPKEKTLTDLKREYELMTCDLITYQIN